MNAAPLPGLDPFENVLSRCAGVNRRGDNHASARCPAHDDQSPSLSVTRDTRDGKVLLHCFAGCDLDATLTALGLGKTDIYPERRATPTARTTEYPYRDAGGTPIAVKVRIDRPTGKATPWKLPSGTWGLNGYRIPDLPLYRLPELLAADPTAPVLFTEGEKACEAARALGFVAVTNAGGAGQADFGDSLAPLAGRRVYLWADNDPPGRALMDRIADRLDGIAAAVYRLDVPGLPEKGDAADFRGTAEDLADLIGHAPRYRDWTVAEARKRVADLEQELARERTERETLAARVAELERENGELREISRTVNDLLAIPSTELNDGEKVCSIVVALEAAAPQNRKADPLGDGYRNSLGHLAERTGCAPQTASTRITRLSRWGLFSKRTVRTRDPATGEWRSELYIDVGGQTAVEVLKRLTDEEYRRTHIQRDPRPEKPRRGCPDCGDVGTHVVCRGCGQVLRKTKPGEALNSPITNPEVPTEVTIVDFNPDGQGDPCARLNSRSTNSENNSPQDNLFLFHVRSLPITSRSANSGGSGEGERAPDHSLPPKRSPGPAPGTCTGCDAPLPPGNRFRCWPCVDRARAASGLPRGEP